MKISTCITLACAAVAVFLLTGCDKTTRSISNSGFPDPYAGWTARDRELNEFDVLGIEPDRSVSEEEIAQAGARAQRVALSRNSTILLVQSGATYPDGPMVTALRKDFDVVPFSGLNLYSDKTSADPNGGRTIVTSSSFRSPPVTGERYETRRPAERSTTQYSRVLRLAAARAGAGKIVCYWGMLESSSEHLATKTISWVPVASWVVPDEVQHMRIRVKVAVIDVQTGNWRIFSPEPFEDKSWSVSPRREVVDQKQVESLKTKAYTACAKDLVQQFVY